jgi:hypothetical protein
MESLKGRDHLENPRHRPEGNTKMELKFEDMIKCCILG